MRPLYGEETLLVAGGDAETRSRGRQLGQVISELKEHPEAVLLGPVLGSSYLATRH